ncbi:MAG: 23S rRNA (uracil(1939)-C(5))-methyltransferase RlmD [Pseudomonadota bacterium]
MAQFFKPKSKRAAAARHQKPVQRRVVEALDHQGRGVVRANDGAVYFIDQVLPTEQIRFRPVKKFQAELLSIEQPAAERQQPPCPYYDRCGGCDLQHLAGAQHQQYKQNTVTELLAKFAGVKTQLDWQPIVSAGDWHYRRKARLAVKWHADNNSLWLGFRQPQSKKVTVIDDCLVLVTALSDLLVPLRQLLSSSVIGAVLGHVELIQANTVHVVLRLTAPLTDQQRQQLLCFAEQHQLQFWLQTETEVAALQQQQLSYDSSIDGDRLYFSASDFLQVNQAANQQMVAQALAWLQVSQDDTVLDLFSGVGNFTLPLARRAAQVVAIEGVAGMTEKLVYSAEQAQLHNVRAKTADLNQITARQLTSYQASLWLLDPARAGAESVCQSVSAMSRDQRPKRIVYVSCAPVTLARDSQFLLQAGYQIKHLGLVDMFPQTHHIETMVCFERVA